MRNAGRELACDHSVDSIAGHGAALTSVTDGVGHRATRILVVNYGVNRMGSASGEI